MKEENNRAEEGSSAIETLLSIPVILMLLAAVLFFGARANVQSSVDAAAAAAARDAALTSDASHATQVARQTVAKNLEDTGCVASEVSVVNAEAAGSRNPQLSAENNTITVHVSCHVESNPLGLNWVPDLGSYQATGKGVVDTRRGD